MKNDLNYQPDALQIQNQIDGLRLEKMAACNAHHAQWLNAENWERKNKKMVSPMQLTPKGERVLMKLAAPLRALERQIAELQTQMPPVLADE